MGRDQGSCRRPAKAAYFNPRAPCGARRPPCPLCPAGPYFNPRAPCGARRTARRAILAVRGFQSTRPVWGATPAFAAAHVRQRHFNPRAPCGARLGQTVGGVTYYNISIHAPRVGRDDEDDWPRMQAWPISIHAPRVGRDSGRRLAALRTTTFQSTRPVWGATTRTTGRACRHGQFQSTRPVWGATRAGSLSLSLSTYFNPRAPCGARRLARSVASIALIISIHAPRVGRDGDGGAYYQMKLLISIHAPRVGRDLEKRLHATNKLLVFQSTRPVWGATSDWRYYRLISYISIHAPRVGRDKASWLCYHR